LRGSVSGEKSAGCGQPRSRAQILSQKSRQNPQRNYELAPGDVLVVYTDGVTEAEDASAAEFGESRLIETVRRNCKATPSELLAIIQNAVQEFSVGEQFDDLTLVIARAR